MTELYRLVYTSKTLLPGPEAEVAEAVAQILRTSQRNNGPAGVTGALMFNRGGFAQVLEGPRAAVEATFERIQRDRRHSDVTVLQCAPVASRGFPNWSMAFVGQSAPGQEVWGGIAAASGFDEARLTGDEVFSVLHGLVLDEEGAADPAREVAADAPARPADLDPRAQMRHLAHSFGVTRGGDAYAAALAEARAGTASPAEDKETGAALLTLELEIVRKALQAERHRVADMAARMEAMQAALVIGEERAAGLRRSRDLWAERARLLALPVFQGVAGLTAGGEARAGAATNPHRPRTVA